MANSVSTNYKSRDENVCIIIYINIHVIILLLFYASIVLDIVFGRDAAL